MLTRFFHFANGRTLRVYLALLIAGLTLLGANSLLRIINEAPRITIGDARDVVIVIPESILEVQPVDICRAASKVEKRDAPNVGGTTYTALTTNASGQNSYFLRWTKAPGIDDRFVVEIKAPNATNPRHTDVLEALPYADGETIRCLERRAS